MNNKLLIGISLLAFSCLLNAAQEPTDKKHINLKPDYKVIKYNEGTSFGTTDEEYRACQAIANNINWMQQHDINWNYEFPISANNYELSKPSWEELLGEKNIRIKNCE